eukprot:gnl/MRDRNA2_/MRDRNA2_86568_c0_seq2.p1 gnl/MRDRNA2_/MRDRNA2_86568_c0~~gnl/MRDRNA2_/MRDRNA2_86568_c0_seq2.p1  ORF type:complete len:876 (+),score=161.37 gnl/MRDRNA2_/MRDRNA2_86568_c0_seq2:108-2735(+)
MIGSGSYNGLVGAPSKAFPTPTMMALGPKVTQDLNTKMPAYLDRLLINGSGFSPIPSENTVYFRAAFEGTTAPTPGCYSVIEATPNRLEILFDLTRLDALHGYIGPLFATVVVNGTTSNEAQVAEVVPSGGPANGKMVWTHIDIKNLAPRKAHSMVSLGHMLYMFGGTSTPDGRQHNFGEAAGQYGVDKLMGDLIEIDCETLEWRTLNAPRSPPRRCLHSATFIDGKMYVFGGAGHMGDITGDDTLNQQHDDLWVYDRNAGPNGTWTEIPKRGLHWPEKRDSHSAFTLNGKLYIIGGNVIGTDNSPPHLAANFYSFDPKTQLWTLIAESDKGPDGLPQASDACPLSRFPSVNVLNDAVWMFGGYPSCNDAQGERLDHLYKYTEGAKSWMKQPDMYFDRSGKPLKPVGRDSHSACTMHDRIYLTGGWQVESDTARQGDMEAFKDTWGFNPMNMKWTPEDQAPHPHHHFASSGDVVSNYFYVMGGVHKQNTGMITGSLHQMVNNQCKVLFEIHKLGYPHVARGLEPPRVIDSGITWEEVEWDAPLDPNAVCDDPNPKPLEYELYYKERDTNNELTFAYKGIERHHRQEGLKPSTWYTWIWRVNNGVGMSGMSPEGDGPTKDEAPKPAPPPPAPVQAPVPQPQFTYIRKPVPEVIQVPQKRMVEQVMMVPVKQMVEVVEMVPQYMTPRFEVEKVEVDKLTPGKTVSLYNLLNNADMNGQTGVLDSYDPVKAAWTIKLTSGQGTVTVKPENLIINESPTVPMGTPSMAPPFPMMPQPQAMVMASPMTSAQGYPAPFMQPAMSPESSSMRPVTPPPAFRELAAPITPVQTVSLGRMTPSRSTRQTSPSMVRGDVLPTMPSPMKPSGLGKPVSIGEFTPRR